VLSVAAFADPHAPLGAWSGTLSFGWLGIIAWGSIAIGQPFTLGLARRRVDRDIWNRPAFKQSQAALTRLWAVVFTLIALGPSPGPGGFTGPGRVPGCRLAASR
jgi:hypothetical protein